MSEPIINESTSVIQINSAGLQNGSVVYVSSTTIPGQLVTIIDATGFVSSPQYIMLSTVGAQLLGVSTIQQRYGYLSLVSQSSNTWTVVNENSFTTQDPIFYRALDAPTVTATTVAAGYASTGTATTVGADIQGTFTNSASMFMSSLYVNTYAGYLSTSDRRVNVLGNTLYYGSTNTIGTFNVRGTISTSGDFTVGGNISSKLGTIYVGGDVTTSGSIRGQRGIQTTVQGVSSLSTATFALAVTTADGVTVGNSVRTRAISTTVTIGNSFAAASSITFAGSHAIQWHPGYLNFLNLPITTPSVSTNYVQASNSITTSNMTFQSFGLSTLQFLTLSSAQITNPNGSLVTSSMTGTRFDLVTLLSPRFEARDETIATLLSLNDAPATVSTTVIYPPGTSTVIGTIVIPMSWLISSTGTNGTLDASNANMSTNILMADLVNATTLDTKNVTLANFNTNSMIVYSTVFFSSATLLSAKGAIINNTGGGIQGLQSEIASYIQLSTIRTDEIITPGRVHFNGNSTFSISSAIVSSITCKTILTSSLAFTTGTLGASMAYSTINPSTPWLLASTFQMNNPPFTDTTGLGTYFDEVAFTAASDQTAYYSAINPAEVPSHLSTPYINTIVQTGKIIGQPASDSLHNLYYGENTVGWRLQKLDSANRITTIAGNYQYFYGDGQYPTNAAMGPKLSVSVVSPGALLVADASNARLRFVTIDPIITTIAGSGQPGYAGDGGLAFNAVFNGPTTTVADSASNIYVADTSNNMVRIITGSTIARYAGTGQAGSTGDGGQALAARLTPVGLAVDSTNLYITDISNCVIRTVNNTTNVIQVFAGNYTTGFSGDGGPATAAAMSYPRGIAVDSNTVYVCDTGNQRVRRINGSIISTIAGNGSSGFTGDGGPAYLAAISSPTGVTTDNNGNLYIADTQNHCIRFVNAQTGIITTVAGQGGRAGYQGNNSFATTALLSTPSYVAYDQSSGYYYIADDGNRRIRLVNSATGVIYDYVGNGSPFSISDKIMASNAVFGSITGTAADLQNNIYVADGAANTISKIDYATNTISTVVFAANPHTVITDASNNLIFCDTNNHRVRKYVSSTQLVTTIAGTGVAGYNGDGIYASTATLNYPKALTLDTAGNIFIGDSSNYRIRRVDPTGYITTVAGTGIQGIVAAGTVSTPIGFATALTADAANIYFTDIPTNGMWQISTNTLQAMNTPSTASYLGDAGPLLGAQFNAPTGLLYDTSGNFVVCDTGRLRRTFMYGLPQTPVYLNMSMTFTNYYATSGVVTVSVNGNRIASYDSTMSTATMSITDTNIYSYPLQNSNPALLDQTPYVQISQTGNLGYIKFEGSFWLDKVIGQGFIQNVVNQDAGIIMNSGTLTFPYQNNGITIQNKYNDISTRNFTYTGSLNNASDPALKEKIRAADLSICYQTMNTLPLKRYNYIPQFASTFRVRDKTRLGFLTSDVIPHFPNSITIAPIEELHSTIHTLDTAQIKCAHLGATQHLIHTVSTLESEVAELQLVLRTARHMATQRNAIL